MYRFSEKNFLLEPKIKEIMEEKNLSRRERERERESGREKRGGESKRKRQE